MDLLTPACCVARTVAAANASSRRYPRRSPQRPCSRQDTGISNSDSAGTRTVAFRARFCLPPRKSKLEYTALAAKFCPPEFTISQLRRVYEAVWSTHLDPGNFQRNVKESGAFEKQGTAEPSFRTRRGRRAALWSVRGPISDGDRSAVPLHRALARRRHPPVPPDDPSEGPWRPAPGEGRGDPIA